MPSTSQRIDQADLLATLSQVFHKWGLSPEARVCLLGLPAHTAPRNLQKYRQGKPMPDPQAFLQRASYLLTIEKAVCRLFPGNPAMAGYWVTTPSTLLANKSPMQIMLEERQTGMRRIVDHLNGEW